MPAFGATLNQGLSGQEDRSAAPIPATQVDRDHVVRPRPAEEGFAVLSNPFFLEIHARHHADALAATARAHRLAALAGRPEALSPVDATRRGLGLALIAAGVRLGAPRPLTPEPAA